MSSVTIDFLGMSVVVRSKGTGTTLVGFLSNNKHRQELVYVDGGGISNIVPLGFVSTGSKVDLTGIATTGVTLSPIQRFVDVGPFGTTAKKHQEVLNEFVHWIPLRGGTLEPLDPQSGPKMSNWELDGNDIFLTDRLRFTAPTTGATVTIGDRSVRASSGGVDAIVLSVDETFGKGGKKSIQPGHELDEFLHFYRLTTKPGRKPKWKGSMAVLDLDPGNPICPFGFIEVE